MATLGEALYRAIAGRGAGREPETWDDAIAYFLTHWPSMRAAADALGVPRSTFSAWARGRRPRDATRTSGVVIAARRAYRRKALSGAKERRLRGEW